MREFKPAQVKFERSQREEGFIVYKIFSASSAVSAVIDFNIRTILKRRSIWAE
jgi:hypothetical protein